MSSADVSFENLAKDLRGWVRDSTRHEQAAVELLIWHETWLRRADFQRACIERRGPVINWRKAREFAGQGTRASTSELAVLRVAVALGEDEFRLSGFGVAHKRAVAEAFAAACGERLEPPIPEAGHSHPDFIPGDPATCHRCALEANDDA